MGYTRLKRHLNQLANLGFKSVDMTYSVFLASLPFQQDTHSWKLQLNKWLNHNHTLWDNHNLKIQMSCCCRLNTLEEKILALDKENEQYKRLLLSAMLINSNPGTWWPLAAARSAGMYRYWSWGALSAQYIVPTRIVYVLLEFTVSVQASCAAPVVLPPVSFAFHFISHFISHFSPG